MKRAKILGVLAFFAYLNSLEANALVTSGMVSIATNPAKYQKIDGFGGTGMNGQWADVYTQEKVNLLWGQGEGQVGLNIMRLRISPDESSWNRATPEYSNPVKWARKVNPNLLVFATPWTPPVQFKKDGFTAPYQNSFGTWVYPLIPSKWGGNSSSGSTILDDKMSDFADYLERYRAAMENAGASVDIISIQNECDYTPTDASGNASYESCIYTPQQMAAMVKAARAAIDPKCKIMGPETFGWGQKNYNTTLLGIADAKNNIDLYGNHFYGSNDVSFSKNIYNLGKSHWMTEYLINYTEGTDYKDYGYGAYGGEFKFEYRMIENIEIAMQNYYTAYVYYNMLDDFFASNHGGSSTQLWKRAYVFSHYAKYATGKTRINTTKSGFAAIPQPNSQTVNYDKLIGGSSYISDDGKTITVFVLNPQSVAVNFTITCNPFVSNKVSAIVTGEGVNAKKIDVTKDYNASTKKLVTTLQPGLFYTFVFEKDGEPEEIVPISPKTEGYGNPINPYQYFADPTAIEYDGRLYVYGTCDQQQFDYTQGIVPNNYSKITSLVCMSTKDMSNWSNHGTIDVKAIAPWINRAWAPSIISRVENDGLTHFYMYFTNGGGGIGVLTSTSPVGPWSDPLGKALIDGNTEGIGKISSLIDPGAAINPSTGEAYLSFGGGDILSSGTDLFPGNARIVKLADDLISFNSSDIVEISAPCHFEANELNFIGNQWIYSYCTRWTIASDWSSYSSSTAPTPCSIVWMSSKTPLANNWVYKGEIMPNPGNLGYPYGNNHSHIQKFNSKYYLFYHTQWLENQNGYAGGYRNIQVNNIGVKVVVTNPIITPLTIETATINGVEQLTGVRVNPYDNQQAEMMNNGAGVTIEPTATPGNTVVNLPKDAWTSVYGINCSLGDGTARSVILKASGVGTIEVRKEQEGEAIATIEVSANELEDVAVELTEELTGIVNNIYFVCTNGSVKIDCWRFSGETTGIKEVNKSKLSGILPDGKYLENGKIIIFRNGKKYNTTGSILY
ncbi:MAG: family 43 glycosylhydrolase [Prevotella sp.]|nr:family 43 glycosylhydrolase [Prevotella sp.]